MSEKSFRLSKLVREFNVKIDRILDFLSSKGITGLNPNSKVSHEVYMQLLQEFDSSKAAKISAQLLAKENELKKAEEIIRQEKEEQKKKEELEKKSNLVKLKIKEVEIKSDASKPNDQSSTDSDNKDDKEEKQELIKAKSKKLKGLTTTGEKIDLSKFDKPEVKTDDSDNVKKKRKRLVKKRIDPKQFRKLKQQNQSNQVEISPEEAQKRVRETLAKLKGTRKKSSVKNRKEKREAHKAQHEQEIQEQVDSQKIIKITEFATANELASLMDVSVTEIITSCMSLGIMISMNQRIDAETIEMLVEDFGYKVEFISDDIQDEIEEERDDEKDLLP